MLATAENAKDFFNGKDLTGWDGDAKLWKVENGEIVGASPGIAKNEFLKSHMTAENFRLILKVKLVPNKENSGVQFRSEVLPNGDVKGYQADIGAGWWGKLYEEHGRELLWKESGEQHVNRDGWNDYEIVAQGSRIKTFLNGKSCVDLDDPPGARRGVFAFQIHSGGPMEVRFKEIKLEVLK
jgi:3-keto-disaccharide hydrolase